VEIFAQWLDDLDDLVMAVPLLWSQARLWILQVGLAAAMILMAVSLTHAPEILATLSTGVAVGCVGLWSVALLAACLGRSPLRAKLELG
jgi:hypothetical protein